MRTWIVQTVRNAWDYRCDTAADENRNGSGQAYENGPFHLVGLNFFAQEFRGAPDHEPCNEHSEDCKGQHPIQAAARTAEDHFTELHQQHWHHAAQRRVAVVHGVDGAVGGRRCERGPCGGGSNAEAGFLALQLAQELLKRKESYETMDR